MKGLNILALVKSDGERYVFTFPDGRHWELLQVLSRYANDPELSLTHSDAVILGLRAEECSK